MGNNMSSGNKDKGKPNLYLAQKETRIKIHILVSLVAEEYIEILIL